MLDTERKLKKIYGDKQAKKMKGDFKREITDVTIMQQKKLLKQYEDAKAFLVKSEKALDQCNYDLAEKIPHEEHQFGRQKQEIDKKVNAFNAQMTAIMDAEREIQR